MKILKSKDGLDKIMHSVNEFNSRLHVRIYHLQRSETHREYPNLSASRKKKIQKIE
jgi:hypothetical protein